MKRLVAMKGRPCADMPGRRAGPLTPARLARLLKTFGIVPGDIGDMRVTKAGGRGRSTRPSSVISADADCRTAHPVLAVRTLANPESGGFLRKCAGAHLRRRRALELGRHPERAARRIVARPGEPSRQIETLGMSVKTRGRSPIRSRGH